MNNQVRNKTRRQTMTRPNDSSGQDAAKWWNDKSKEELEQLEFLQKQMRRAMNGGKVGPEDEEEEEDMGPPDLPEDDDMGPPDLPEDDEMALEPTDREMDSQSRMTMRRETAMRRPRSRNRARRMMRSGVPRGVADKALRAEMQLKRAFSPEKRRDLAKSGIALPDGSFPIVTTEDLKNAIMAFGRAKNKAAAKRHIIKRARALKKTSLIPENWGKKDARDASMRRKGMSGTPTEVPKKRMIRYGESETDAAEMEDDDMTSPMSRDELMKRVFRDKKKKKPDEG